MLRLSMWRYHPFKVIFTRICLHYSGNRWLHFNGSILLLLLSGSTADQIGRKQVLQLGLACFGLASLPMWDFANPRAIDRVSHVARDWWFYVKIR